jgi:hypothetical protein
MALKSFSVQLQEFIEKTGAKGDLVVRSTLLKLDSKLVDRSPVGDAAYWKHPAPPGYVGGRFRGNWQASLNSPATGETGRIDADGGATLAANAGVISQAKAGGVQYLINNVPYAQRIEEGWSRQAPIGLVAVTVVEFRTMVDNAVNEVRQGTSAADFAQGWSTYKL